MNGNEASPEDTASFEEKKTLKSCNKKKLNSSKQGRQTKMYKKLFCLYFKICTKRSSLEVKLSFPLSREHQVPDSKLDCLLT